MRTRAIAPLALSILALAAGCAEPAADRDENTGTLLENATPPPAVDATDDASRSAPATDPVLSTDYGNTGPSATVPPTEAAGTPADNGAVQMRTDSARPVGPVP